jgi:hypothetical protein
MTGRCDPSARRSPAACLPHLSAPGPRSSRICWQESHSCGQMLAFSQHFLAKSLSRASAGPALSEMPPRWELRRPAPASSGFRAASWSDHQ